MLKTVHLGSERVQTPSWKVLEESGRVENFHNGSEHTVRSPKPGEQGITPSLSAALPDEASSVGQKSGFSGFAAGGYRFRSDGYPKTIPSQKSSSGKSAADNH